jgi:hypothetical protein
MAVGTRSCPSCGKPVVADARFCPNCGATLAFQQPPTPSYTPPQSYPAYQTPYPPPPPKKSKTKLIIVIVIVVIVVIGVIGSILALGALNSILSSTHSTILVNGVLTVQPGQYYYYEFLVPSGATTAVVSGSFSISPGTSSTIEVLVFNQTNYVSWSGGHAATSYYDSGQVASGTVNANLPGAGTYYLVYSNSVYTAAVKSVQTTVNLTYIG